jgi:nitroreductase
MSTFLTRRSILAALGVAVAVRPRAALARDRPLERLLGRRRMVRRFTADPVSDAVVTRLLAAAIRAPSAGHTQPWSFVIVRDEKMRAALARAAYGQMFVADAPVVIVPCADMARSRAKYGERGERYSLIDTAFAALCLLLAVAEEGLGACFVGAIADGEVSRLLGLPSRVQPLAVIPIGYPAESPRPMKLRPLDEVVHRERWRAAAEPARSPGTDPRP